MKHIWFLIWSSSLPTTAKYPRNNPTPQPLRSRKAVPSSSNCTKCDNAEMQSNIQPRSFLHRWFLPRPCFSLHNQIIMNVWCGRARIVRHRASSTFGVGTVRLEAEEGMWKVSCVAVRLKWPWFWAPRCSNMELWTSVSKVVGEATEARCNT
jgi:hypothetical protein